MIYLLLISIFTLGQLFLPQIFAQNEEEQHFEDTVQIEELVCNASDPASFKECIQRIRNNEVPLLKIIKPIICESRNDCEFDLSRINADVIIHTTNPENKILRKNDYSYTLFKIEDSGGLRFTNLIIEDEEDKPCGAGVSCPPLITLKSTEKITFEKMYFLKTRGVTVSSVDSTGLIIKDSNFSGSQKSAVQISSTLFQEGIKIENNTFEGNTGQAIDFQTQSLGVNPASIVLNTFVNNHAKGAFSNCVYPCVGSQLKITGPTVNLVVSRNIVSGGRDTAFDIAGLYASGIEIGNNNVSRLSVFCNQVSGNRGSGIVEAPPFSKLSEINISGNKIWNNGLNLNIPVATIQKDNCFSEKCTLACFSN